MNELNKNPKYSVIANEIALQFAQRDEISIKEYFSVACPYAETTQINRMIK